MNPTSIPPEILEKIRRCLALGERSTFENEAATAMRMANKLMEQYGLSRASIDMDPEGHLKKEKITKNYSKPYWMAPWEKTLCRVPELLVPVSMIFNFTFDNHIRLMFVGTEQDTALAIEIYAILRKELLRISRDEPDGVSRRSFLLGAAEILTERGQEVQRAREKARPGTAGFQVDPGSALVVVKGQDIAAYVEANIKTKPVRTRGPEDFDDIAHERGRKAGAHVNLGLNTALIGGNK